MIFNTEIYLDFFRLGWLEIERRMLERCGGFCWMPAHSYSSEVPKTFEGTSREFDALFKDLYRRVEEIVSPLGRQARPFTDLRHWQRRCLDYTVEYARQSPGIVDSLLLQDFRRWTAEDWIWRLIKMGTFTYLVALVKAAQVQSQFFRIDDDTVPVCLRAFGQMEAMIEVIKNNCAGTFNMDHSVVGRVLESCPERPFDLWHNMAELIKGYSLNIEEAYVRQCKSSGGGKFLKSSCITHQPA